uniref:hypothetical protein n=1 Tax=uncultured Sphingomonas sp. TaxID=158754 RepID=UPI0035CA0F8F
MTFRCSILVLSALLLAAAPDRDPPPVPLRLIATVTPQGEQTVAPGMIISVAGIAAPNSAILAGDIALDWKGEQRKFARGDVLRAGARTGIAGVPEAIFCEDLHLGSFGKALTGQLAFGLVGALRPTQVDTRFCLFDANKDDRFDHAVLIGAKGKGRVPFVIAPVEYGVIEGRRLSDDSVAQLRYAGPAGAPDSIAFDLEAYTNGMFRTVPHDRTFVSIAKLPNYAVIGVAVVTVLAYDPKTHSATIRMDHDLAPGHIVLPELNRGY